MKNRTLRKILKLKIASAAFFYSIALTASVMQPSGKEPKTYRQYNLPYEMLEIAAKYLPPNPVIIEAGAFDGKESCILAEYFPMGTIHSFEPIHSLYQCLYANTQSFSNIFTYQYALGDKNEIRSMYTSHDESLPGFSVSMSSSLLPPKEHLIYSDTEFKGLENVQVITLEQWAKNLSITKVDMLWLDMQGYELPAMKAAGNLLDSVIVILTELEFCEAYEGQSLYEEVRSFLEERGFELVAGNFAFPKNPNQWFGDGLFIRKTAIKENKHAYYSGE